MSGQMPDAIANFVVPAEIKTMPEHPSFCRSDIGVMVTVDGDYADNDVTWNHTNTGTILKGKSQTLKHAGIWKINVKYNLNGATCEKTKAINVSDLNDPFQIQSYFSQAGFWPVTIYRSPEDAPQCRGCGCEGDLERVSFKQELSFGISLLDDFEKFQAFKPFQGMEYSKKISNNACLCNVDGSSNISVFEATLADGDLSLWGHQFFENEETSEGILYVKASMSWQQSSPIDEHRNRLNKIVDDIISQNQGASNQARVIFTNLFMTDPIGGYELTPSCPDPEGCKADGNYLSPAGAIIKLPENGSQFYFAQKDNNLGVIEGSLLGFNDGTQNRIPFKYLNNQFAGYYNDLTASVFSGFNGVDATGGLQKIYFPITSDGECKIRNKNVDLPFSNDIVYGGIGDILPNFKPDFYTLSTGYLNADAKSASFLAGTGKIISLPYLDIQDISFAYNSYSDGDVRNISNGILHKFELENSETCEGGIYTYREGEFVYKNENGFTYVDIYESVEKFNYPMMCDGKFRPYVIFDSVLQKHDNTGPSYINDFDGLTSFFTPSSNFLALESSKKKCTYCIGDEFAKIITNSKYCGQPEHIFVEKIAQLATVYPDYFKDPYPIENTLCSFGFTQMEKWEKPEDRTVINSPVVLQGDTYWPWGVYLKENPEVFEWHNAKNVLFFKRMLSQMNLIKTNQIKWWDGVANKTTDEIICHLRGEPQSITSTIPWDKKLIALNKLYNGNFLGILSNDLEYSVIHILESSSPLEVLSHIEEKEIKYYWDNFHDFGGEDNLSRVITSICANINKKAPNFISMEGFLEDPNTIPKLESDFFKNSNLIFKILDNNKVEINNEEYYYDDLIPIEFSGTCTFGESIYKKGALINMPAIQAALFAYDNNKVTGEKAAWVAVDIGLLWIGIGSAKIFLTGGNYLRKISVGADIIGSSAGISVQLINNDAISPELRSQIQICAMALSLGEVAVSLSKVVLKIDELHDVGKLNNIGIATSEASNLTRAAIIVDGAPNNIVALTDAFPSLREVWRALLTSPLRNSEEALLISRKMLDDGFDASHINNIARDCNHDIRGFEIADILGTKPITKIEAASMTRKAFQNGIDQYLEVITKNDGIYLGNDINGWQKLKNKIDAVANGDKKQAIEIGALEVSQGKKIQIENGNADLEVFLPANEKASYQMKEVSGALRGPVIDADAQLGGIHGETPSVGHKKIVEVKLTNQNDALINLNESELLNALQGLSPKLEFINAESFIVKNNIGRFIYNTSLF